MADPTRRKAADCRVLVLAKAPIEGRVKTRLIPAIGAAQAAALQASLTRRALATANAAAVGPVELHCAPSSRYRFFRESASEFGAVLEDQGRGNLGSRMARAFQAALDRSRAAVAIGSDCPALGPSDITRCADLLAGGFDAVIVPAEDGGYVLLGLARFSPRLFARIAWGEASVLAATRDRLRSLQWRWHELPGSWDVDRPEDYERLRRSDWLGMDLG